MAGKNRRKFEFALVNFRQIRVLVGDGRLIATVELDLHSLGASVDLPYAPGRYFNPTVDSLPIEISDLVAVRARPRGVENAADLMRAAYVGSHPRRDPISVFHLAGADYAIADGNSTFLNAIASHWPDIPCRVVERGVLPAH